MKRYAVFGNPIAHSVSPRLHNAAFGEFGERAFYGRVLLNLDDDLLVKFERLGLSGANVTVPFKETILDKCDFLSPAAREIGSVNTIVRRSKGICAYNTDAPGFMRAIAEFGRVENALILGAGGTARALAYALSQSGAKVGVLNRSEGRAAAFSKYDFFTPATFANSNLKYDLVVNTTPAGLVNNELPFSHEIMERVFAGAKFAFDAVYGRNTPFLALASDLGLRAKDGKDMLLFQAVLAFLEFTDNRFKFESVERAMRSAIDL